MNIKCCDCGKTIDVGWMIEGLSHEEALKEITDGEGNYDIMCDNCTSLSITGKDLHIVELEGN